MKLLNNVELTQKFVEAVKKAIKERHDAGRSVVVMRDGEIMEVPPPKEYGPKEAKESLRKMSLAAETLEYKAKKTAWEKVKTETLIQVRKELRREATGEFSERLYGFPVFSWDKSLGVVVDNTAIFLRKQAEENSFQVAAINQMTAELSLLRKLLQPIYRHANSQYNKWTITRDKKETFSYGEALEKLIEYGNIKFK